MMLCRLWRGLLTTCLRSIGPSPRALLGKGAMTRALCVPSFTTRKIEANPRYAWLLFNRPETIHRSC